MSQLATQTLLPATANSMEVVDQNSGLNHEHECLFHPLDYPTPSLSTIVEIPGAEQEAEAEFSHSVHTGVILTTAKKERKKKRPSIKISLPAHTTSFLPTTGSIVLSNSPSATSPLATTPPSATYSSSSDSSAASSPRGHGPRHSSGHALTHGFDLPPSLSGWSSNNNNSSTIDKSNSDNMGDEHPFYHTHKNPHSHKHIPHHYHRKGYSSGSLPTMWSHPNHHGAFQWASDLRQYIVTDIGPQPADSPIPGLRRASIEDGQDRDMSGGARFVEGGGALPRYTIGCRRCCAGCDNRGSNSSSTCQELGLGQTRQSLVMTTMSPAIVGPVSTVPIASVSYRDGFGQGHSHGAHGGFNGYNTLPARKLQSKSMTMPLATTAFSCR